MKPIGKEYEKEVSIQHVWECVIVEGEKEPQTFLVSKPVSEYIRKLEHELKEKRGLVIKILEDKKN